MEWHDWHTDWHKITKIITTPPLTCGLAKDLGEWHNEWHMID